MVDMDELQTMRDRLNHFFVEVAREAKTDHWQHPERDDNGHMVDEYANPGKHCATCLVRNSCPALHRIYKNATRYMNGQMGTLGNIQSEGDAIVALKTLYGLNAIVKDHEEALRGFVETNGSIPAHGGKVYGFHRQTRTVMPNAKNIYDALTHAGIEHDQAVDIFSTTKTAVQRALKKIQPERGQWKTVWNAVIEPMVQTTEQIRVGLHKPDEPE